MLYCTESRIHEGLEEAAVQIKGAAEFPEDTAYGVVEMMTLPVTIVYDEDQTSHH